MICSRFFSSWEKINIFVSDRMKTIKRTFSPNMLNHIYLDFGDGLMGGIKYNRKKLTNLSWEFLFT